MDFSLDFTKVLLILIILSMLGLNIFFYLARGTNLLGIATIGVAETGVETAKQVISNTKQGASQALNTTNKGLTGGLGELEKMLDIQVKHQNIMNQANVSTDDSNSPFQSQLKSGKSGYCFIGEDKDGRNCTKIGKSQTCMSGDIFPTWDICVNPSLRV